MKNLSITGKQIRTIGYPEGPVVSVAMHVIHTKFKHHTQDEAFEILKAILNAPENYLNDEILKLLAGKTILEARKKNKIENQNVKNSHDKEGNAMEAITIKLKKKLNSI